MTKYVKKPETIEAFQLPEVDDIDGRMEMEDWIEEHKGPEQEFRYKGDELEIRLTDGAYHRVAPRDWLVVLESDGIHPMYEKIFSTTYELENTVTVINVDSRGAEQGVEEKISEILAEVLPLAMKQASEMAVIRINAESKRRGRDKI